MERIVAKPDLFVDKNENPMDILGIGTNMVKALRYWLQAVGLTEEPTTGRRVQNLTEFGQAVYENDRYIEELGTLYLLQYQLAKRKTDATSWYFSLMNLICPNLQRKSLYKKYKIMLQCQTEIQRLLYVL